MDDLVKQLQTQKNVSELIKEYEKRVDYFDKMSDACSLLSRIGKTPKIKSDNKEQFRFYTNQKLNYVSVIFDLKKLSA